MRLVLAGHVQYSLRADAGENRARGGGAGESTRMPNDDGARGNIKGWQPELDELRARERLARAMGGADKVRRQHEGGRLTIRERIEELVDPGSLREVGAIAGVAGYDADNRLQTFIPSNRISGRATIDGRPVIVSGRRLHGTRRLGRRHHSRRRPSSPSRWRASCVCRSSASSRDQAAAARSRPSRRRGASNLPGGLGGSSMRYKYMTDNLGLVPVVALGLGSVAGLGAAQVAASHYSVMTKSTSAMFVAGPPVVARIGDKQSLDKQQLGGWEIQCAAGAIDDAVDTEAEAFERTRKFLSYLPSSVYDVSPRGPREDSPNRREERLFTAVPRDRNQPYRMRPIIAAVVDLNSFFEMGTHFGRPVISGLRGWTDCPSPSSPAIRST